MKRIAWWLVVASLLSSNAFAEENSAAPFTGEAVYDLSLDPKDANGGLAGLEGVLSFTFRKVCQSYDTDLVMKVDIVGPGDHILSMETRTRQIESATEFAFDNRQEMAGVLVEDVRGRATKEAGRIRVEIERPERDSFILEGDVLFPMEMLLAAIVDAREGEKLAEYSVFLGSDDEKTPIPVVVLFGEGKPSSDGEDNLFASALGFKDMDRWPMSFSYYPPGVAGDMPPTLTVTSTVYANGFMQAGVYDFGSFAMRLSLAEFKPLEPVPCS